MELPKEPVDVSQNQHLRKTPARPTARQDSSLHDRVLAHLSRETSSGRFIPEMDGLRFIAIGMVFFFHLNGFLVGYFSTPANWLQRIAAVGSRGVELFFVISGFILGLPFILQHLKGGPPVKLSKYYLRRLTRLEPPYFVAVIGLALFLHLRHGTAFSEMFPHVAAGLTYLNSVVYGALNPIIVVAWSLEIEVQFYLLVPLLTLLFAIKNKPVRRCILLALVMIALVAQPSFLRGNARLSLSIFGYLQFFLMGFLLADIFATDWNEGPKRTLYWDLIALAGWPILFVVLQSRDFTHWLFPFLILLLYCATFRGIYARYVFTNPWITAIGGMCYSIYLVHYQVISAMGYFTKKIGLGQPYWLHFTVQAVLLGAAVLVVSSIYFVFLEKPCMRRDWPQRLWNFTHHFFVPRQ